MYAAHPEIKNTGKIRVVRTEPKWWTDPFSGSRSRANGILIKHDPPMSTASIEQRFGGYKYEVYGMIEKYDREDSGGPPSMVDIAVAEFEIPAEPITNQKPVEDGEAMFPFWRRGGAAVQGQNGGDFSSVFQFAKEMAQGGSDRGTPNSAFETVARQSEMSSKQIQELANQQITALREQNQRLESRLEDMQRYMQEKAGERPNDLGSIINGVAALNQSTRTSASSDELQALRDQNEREMSRLREDHRNDMDRLGRERDREVDRLRIDADARVDRAEEKSREVRESFERRERDMRDEFERRERQMRDEQKRAMEAQAQNYESRLSSQSQNYESRMNDTRQSHDREVRMLKSMQDNTVTTTQAAHNVQLQAAQGELAKLTVELGQKQQLVDAAVADKNRPLIDQVAEIKNTAELLGIASDKEPVISPTGDSAPLYEKLLMGLISKADTLLPQVSALAGKALPGMGGADQAQQQAAAQQQAMMMQGQPPPNALPPRPVSRVSFADSSGPPSRAQDVSVHQQTPQERADMSPSVSGPAPMPYMAPQPGPMPMQDPMAGPPVPVQDPMAQPGMQPAAPTAGDFIKPDEAQEASPGEQPAQDGLTEEPWSKFDWIPLGKDDVQGLSVTLVNACAQKLDPVQLVGMFIKDQGIDVLSMIPQLIDLNKFVESVRTDVATRSTILATGKGKRYLEDVWEEINKAVAQKASNPEVEEPVQAAEPEPSVPSSEESVSQPQP
jgi:hypothetical protein